MPTTTTRRGPAIRAGRRLLGSSLVDSLVGPHGVDRYLELVRPNWTLNEPRGADRARRAPDRRQRHR